MVVKGHMENGMVVFDEPVSLPEGTSVHVEPAFSGKVPSLADQFRDIIGILENLPTDLAEQHDHYLHGTPKR